MSLFVEMVLHMGKVPMLVIYTVVLLPSGVHKRRKTPRSITLRM